MKSIKDGREESYKDVGRKASMIQSRFGCNSEGIIEGETPAQNNELHPHNNGWIKNTVTMPP